MSRVDHWVLPEGIEELLPEQAAQAEFLRRTLLDLYSRWGYELVIPPLVEFTDSLLVGQGKDMDLQTFRLTDQYSGKQMGVRADITPQAARIDAHSLSRQGPVRLCYAGSVLHTRKKNPKASRSPIQLGAELYGDNSSDADIEIISLMLATLEAAGLDSITLDLGHVGIYDAVIAAAGLDERGEAEYFDILQRKAQVELQGFLDSANLDADANRQLQALSSLYGGADVLQRGRAAFSELPKALKAIDELQAVAEQLSARFPSVAFYFDLAELRGYHYHTGLVFAALQEDYSEELALGGRYDAIGARFGRDRAATGFSIDLKALLQLGASAIAATDAIAAPAGSEVGLWRAIQALRDAGETVIQELPGHGAGLDCRRRLVQRNDEWVVE